MRPGLPTLSRRHLLLGSAAGALLAAEANVRANTPPTLRWGYLSNYQPFSWVPRDAQTPQGFHVDLGTEIARSMQVKADIRVGTYAEMLQALRRKDIDVLGNFFTRVPDLVGDFAFTAGLQEFRLMLAQHEDDDRTFLTLDEIPIERLGLMANTTVEDQVQAALGKGYRRFNRIDEALAALAKGQLDAVIEESLIVEYAIHAQKLPIKTTTPMSAPVRLGMLVLKGRTDLLEQLNRSLQSIRQDGSAAKVSEKWFGYDVTQRRAAGTYINPLTPD